jgi:hypothetical protein
MHAGTSAQALVWNNTRDDLSAVVVVVVVVVVGCHCINGQWRAMGIVRDAHAMRRRHRNSDKTHERETTLEWRICEADFWLQRYGHFLQPLRYCVSPIVAGRCFRTLFHLSRH